MSEPQSGPSSGPQISTNPGERGYANLAYILYLVGLVTGGLGALVGVIMAYVAKDEAPDWLKSHYHNQINIFWKGLLYGVAGFILAFILIGFLIWFAALVWYIVRVVKGLQTLSRGEPYPAPSSWGF